MQIPDQLRCLFSARLEEQDGSYIVEIPKREVRDGDLSPGETYRIAMLASQAAPEADEDEPEPRHRGNTQKPPVEEGEQRTVEIDDIGDQGDGITRVERGFVVIVPDTEQGERVTVEIEDVQETVAFARVVERVSYYE